MKTLHLTVYHPYASDRKLLFQGSFDVAILEKMDTRFYNLMMGEELANTHNLPIVVNASYKELIHNNELSQWGDIMEFKTTLGLLLLACIEFNNDGAYLPISRVFSL